jgi:hypothetical protein
VWCYASRDGITRQGEQEHERPDVAGLRRVHKIASAMPLGLSGISAIYPRRIHLAACGRERRQQSGAGGHGLELAAP